MVQSADERVGCALNFSNKMRLAEILNTELISVLGEWEYFVRIVTGIRADILRVIRFLLTRSAIESVRRCEITSPRRPF